MILALMQAQPQLSMDAYISIGVLVVIIGAAWRLSSQLTEIKIRIENLKHVPAHIRHIETHLLMLEDDVNNLWADRRGDPDSRIHDRTRASRFKPFDE